MSLIALNCRNCGAPLQVPDDLKHVTCMHCGTQLAVVHEGGAAYTEKIDSLAERTEQIEDKLDVLHREQKLAALDRDWDKEQESFMIRSKNGSKHLPSKTGSILSGVIACGIGIFVMTIDFGNAGSNGPGGFFVMLGFLFMIIGVGMTLWQLQKADAYEKAKRRYENRRQQIRRG